MATASVTYTFATGTTILASKANTNFNDLVSFLNGSVIHKDASVAFTGVPAGPASDPTTDNQFTRKAYVDTADKARPKAPNATLTGKSTTINGSTTQLIFQGGTATGTTASGGKLAITFPSAFPTGALVALGMNGDASTGAIIVSASSVSTTTATFQLHDAAGAALADGLSRRIDWIAIGW